MKGLREIVDRAEAFAEEHAVELAQNIEEWNHTVILPPDCAMRHLSELVTSLFLSESSERLRFAETLANKVIRQKFIQMSKG